MMKDITEEMIFENAMTRELSKIEQLSITGKSISSLITGTASMRRMSNLKELNLSNNRISMVAALSELKSLTSLNLSSNRIEELKNLNMPILTTLILDHNLIRVLSGFRGLKKLEELSISDNLIENASIQETGFQLVSLAELNLSGNQIRTVGKLFGFPYIKDIVLNRNPITSIESIAFSACPELTSLSLNDIKLPNYQGDLKFLRQCQNLEQL